MAKLGEGMDYGVSLSPSGLLIEIDAVQNGERVCWIQIDRTAWPSIIEAVSAVLTENRVDAEISTILGGAEESQEDG